MAVVSGSSGGLGKAYAEWLAARGANVIVNGTSDRVKGAVEELSTLPGQVHGIEADVGDFSECRALVEKTLERWGRIDILINNAGDEPARFNRVMSELDPSDLASALRVNVYGAYNLTLAAWGALKERRSGRVVLVDRKVPVAPVCPRIERGGKDGVDANSVRASHTGERSSEAHNSGLCGGFDGRSGSGRAGRRR